MNILIVEDNPLMRALLRETVSEWADGVIECSDGDEAFAAYEASLPAWVLMDIQMPRVDGFAASRQIKAVYPEARICIVTDYGDAMMRRAAEAVGATAFVLKENLRALGKLFGVHAGDVPQLSLIPKPVEKKASEPISQPTLNL